MLHNIITLKIFTILSKLLGLCRDIAISRFLDVSKATTDMLIGFSITFQLRRMLSEGVFDTGYIGWSKKANILDHTITNIAIGTFIISLLVYFIIYLAIPLTLNSNTDAQTNLYTRVSTSYFLLAPVAYLLTGILQNKYNFLIYSIMPVMMNIILILFICTTRNQLIISSGFIISAFIQLMLVIYYVKDHLRGINFSTILFDTYSYISYTLPIALHGLIICCNGFFMIYFATMCNTVYEYYYIDKIKILPISLIGNILAIAILPRIAQLYHQKDTIKIAKHFNSALQISLLFGIPATFGMLSIADLIATKIFDFPQQIAQNFVLFSYLALMLLPGSIIARIIQSFAYAQQKQRLYLFLSIISLILTIIISYILYIMHYGFYSVLIAHNITLYATIIALCYTMQLKPNYCTCLYSIYAILISILMYIAIVYIKGNFTTSITINVFIGFVLYAMISYPIIRKVIKDIKE